MEKARKFQKNIYLYFTDYAKAFDCVDHDKPWKLLKRWEYQTLYLSLEKPVSGQEPTVRTKPGRTPSSELVNEYDNVVYCHPA